MLDLDLGFYQWRLGRSYRLNRIDAPEIRAEGGLAAKDALAAFLLGKSLVAHTAKADSFDRWLVELYADNGNMNDWMVANGFAVYRTY